MEMKQIPYDFTTRWGYHYFATEDGHIYSGHLKRNIYESTDKDGYKKVNLQNGDGSRKVFSVHRLVLASFSPRNDMEQLQVNHIDGDKTNNTLSNLEWVTAKENVAHAFKTGLRKNIEDNNPGPHKLCSSQVKEIIELLLTKQYTHREIAEKYGVGINAIENIKYHKTWKTLTENIDFH